MRPLLLIYFLFPFTILFAQGTFQFERIGNRELRNITHVYCDSKGFVWVGTWFGLKRYDGVTVKKWLHNKKDKHSLPHNTVRNITEDKQKRLWVGTQEGISRYDEGSNRFINYTSFEKNNHYLLSEYCFVFSDNEGDILSGYSNRIGYYDFSKDRFIDIITIPNQGVCTRLYQDSKNRLWASTSQGLYKLRKQGVDPIYVVEKIYKPQISFNAVTEDENGNLLAGTWHNGIHLLNETTDFFESLLPGQNHNVTSTTFSLYITQIKGKSYLLAGTIDGLYCIRTNDLLKKKYTGVLNKFDELNPKTIPYGSVNHITKDQWNNIWLGDKELAKINLNNQVFKLVSTGKVQGEKWWPHDLCSDLSEKAITWIATHKQLLRFNNQTLQITESHTAFIKGGIWSLDKGKNVYWVATDKGIFRCDKNWKVLQHYHQKSHPAIADDRTRFIKEDKDGKVWIATWRKGIDVLNPATGKIEMHLGNKDTPGAFTNCIFEDTQGLIWIGQTSGLYRFNKQKNKTDTLLISTSKDVYEEKVNVKDIYESQSGKIWVGTRDGLFYFQNNKLHQVEFPGPEWNQNVSGITEDNNGTLWLGTNAGITNYNPKTNKFRSFSTDDGLADDDVTNLFNKDDEGNVYAGGFGAFAFFNPSAFSNNTYTSPVLITAIRIDNQPVNHLNNTFSLTYRNSFSVGFVSPNYTNPQFSQYAYQLEGIDKDWVNIGNTRTLYFSNLNAGNYTLKIKAANSDGVWGKELLVRIKVMPPFYSTWWFYIACIIALGLLIYAVYRYQLRQALKMERLRTRIATDLHDDIGATLSSISMYSDVVKSKVENQLPELEPVLQKIGDNSRSMVGSMSDIVWAINPDNDSVEKLLHRIESFAQDTCAAKGIQFHFSADERLLQTHLSLEQRKNTYLIFKEAFNNAMKYSGAEHISVTVTKEQNLFCMQIHDDGRGFNLRQKSNGNGLKNMRLRADEIEGRIQIVDQNGILVQLKYPL